MHPTTTTQLLYRFVDSSLMNPTTAMRLDALSVAEESREERVGEHDIAGSEGPAYSAGVEEGGWG